jgi:uncharacterized membrane protein
MDALRTLLPLAALIAICDVPWLLAVGPWARTMFKSVQGGAPMEFRLAALPPIYLALAYLLSRTGSTADAFLLGAATYAVYDFTNLATLGKYELNFALADSLWGGCLFALARTVAVRIGLL